MSKRIWATVFLLLWMAVIFSFSAQVADDSGAQSMGMVELIRNILEKLFPSFGNLGEEVWFEFEVLLRKCAHGFIYFILGILSYNFAKSYSFRYEKSISAAICLLYSVSDEIHQLFVPGRSGQISDVLIDFIGSICGIFLLWLLSRRRKV